MPFGNAVFLFLCLGRPLSWSVGGPVGAGHPAVLHGDGVHALQGIVGGRAQARHPGRKVSLPYTAGLPGQANTDQTAN